MAARKDLFSRALGVPGRLHMAAHSHHLWPDVTLDAQVDAWRDAAVLADHKWDKVFGEVYLAAQGLVALVQKPVSGKVPPNWRPYMDKLPKDAWGNALQYRAPGLHAEVDVFSLGADGAEGGEGYDADIGNWAQ